MPNWNNGEAWSTTVPFIHTVEDVSKNHQFGLKGWRLFPSMKHYDNEENRNCCFVWLLQFCLPTWQTRQCILIEAIAISNKWFTKQPLGHNVLSNMVNWMCLKAGITGYKTNYSPRATTASRLYHEGVDEQLIMEPTGHRSFDGIRSYKRTSSEQVMVLSDVLNNTTTVNKRKKSSDESDCHYDLSKLQLNGCSNISIIFKNGD